MPDLRAAIVAYIREYLASGDERLGWVREAVRRHDFLPLHLGWVAAHGIRPDGTVVRWDYGDETERAHAVAPQPEQDPYWRRVALAQAAKRYPALEPLVPDRPAEAVDCETCGGSGTVPDLPAELSSVICRCGGIGWLLPGEPPPSSSG